MPVPRSNSRVRMLAGNSARIVLLLALIAGAGAVAGMAIGYPLKSLNLGATDAVTLDQEALWGTIDASQALVQLPDLPKSFAAAPDSVLAGVDLLGATYCGEKVSLGDQVGDVLKAAFIDVTNHTFMLAEVAKIGRPSDARSYIPEMTALFDGCKNQRFFRQDTYEGKNVEVRISDDRRDPPLAADYVNRTLTPVHGGTVQIVSYFQVGNVIVAIQYAGPSNPPKTLMKKAELEVLYRVAPDAFKRTTTVRGEKPLPSENATTTTPDLVQPSPTSSPPLPPTTTPTPPTFETPTTVKSTRRKTTTTTVKPPGGA